MPSNKCAIWTCQDEAAPGHICCSALHGYELNIILDEFTHSFDGDSARREQLHYEKCVTNSPQSNWLKPPRHTITIEQALYYARLLTGRKLYKPTDEKMTNLQEGENAQEPNEQVTPPTDGTPEGEQPQAEQPPTDETPAA